MVHSFVFLKNFLKLSETDLAVLSDIMDFNNFSDLFFVYIGLAKSGKS